MSAIELLFRTVFIFLLLFLLARLLGRKLISKMTFFDYVSGITLGSLCANIILNNNLNLKVMVISPIFFMLLSVIFGIVAMKSLKARKWINSEPHIIIRNGSINEGNMKKLRLTSDALLMLLRKKNIFYLNEIDIAIMETDGTLSVLKKTQYLPATKQDLKVPSKSRGIPQVIINDGILIRKNLENTDKDEEWLNTVLKSRGISSIKEVFLAQIDEDNSIHIEVKENQQ